MTIGYEGLREDSATVVARTYGDMERQIVAGGFTLKEKIALACRFLADEGHAMSLAGQISVRNDDGSFWTTGFAHGFADTTAGNLVRVNANLEVLEGEGMANPGARFHSWIYAARPDLRAIVHTHPPHASAIAMAGERLVISHMDMAMLHDEIAYLDRWPGVPLANEEGEIISTALGDRNAILLVNHGALAAGGTVEQATFLLASMEHAARLQLLCRGAGYRPIAVADDLAADAKRFMTKPKFIQATFDYWCRQTLRRHPEVLG
ncbi:aldolase [Sphingomonas histidinilytica]|uniref:L-fuculose-phosphate aldolase n=1 Tax=Rhizorhabdus histidinilytica TaxID=439228 RepID=A0A1T5G9W0_9SPHN|nr:aldolase [Rhizorhabdus histidinilytica]MBO9379891.1 aldolase [Rhizorhabdus histidinilytica]QEH77137.1 aldolase [Sphingomonas sp. C8-2]SKC05208.1 L-fuculose-phosphate aldolase [Rhizorhabdus histidinilytica]